MAKSTYTFTWNGDEAERRFRRAIGRATIATGEGVSAFGKQFVHVESGDLMRSIHTAVARTLGEREPNQWNIQDRDGAVLDVGSWLDYACVEEVGRMHQFMHPAIDAERPFTETRFRVAFKQEGF